jgi:AraC-like DNA-binding protein
MDRSDRAVKVIKRVLYLTGLFAEDASDSYPAQIPGIGARMDKLLISKKLYLDPELTISVLAKEVGTNRTYLSKYISHEKKCGFREYLNSLRCEHAQSLLSKKDLTLSDISIISGFGSIRAMNRVFSKYYGKLPSKIRKELLIKDSAPLLQKCRQI